MAAETSVRLTSAEIAFIAEVLEMDASPFLGDSNDVDGRLTEGARSLFARRLIDVDESTSPISIDDRVISVGRMMFDPQWTARLSDLSSTGDLRVAHLFGRDGGTTMHELVAVGVHEFQPIDEGDAVSRVLDALGLADAAPSDMDAFQGEIVLGTTNADGSEDIEQPPWTDPQTRSVAVGGDGVAQSLVWIAEGHSLWLVEVRSDDVVARPVDAATIGRGIRDAMWAARGVET